MVPLLIVEYSGKIIDIPLRDIIVNACSSHCYLRSYEQGKQAQLPKKIRITDHKLHFISIMTWTNRKLAGTSRLAIGVTDHMG